MSYSGTTKNLGLPQWLATDKPNFDIDINSAFDKIDTHAGVVDETTNELDAKINTTNATIDDVQKEITSTKDSINVLEERQTEAENDIAGNTASINKLNTDVINLQGSTGGYQTEIDALNTEVEDLKTQQTVNTNNIASAMSDITSIKGDVSDVGDNVNTALEAIGQWSTAYPSDTITEKVQELEDGGGGDTNSGSVYLNILSNNGVYGNREFQLNNTSGVITDTAGNFNNWFKKQIENGKKVLLFLSDAVLCTTNPNVSTDYNAIPITTRNCVGVFTEIGNDNVATSTSEMMSQFNGVFITSNQLVIRAITGTGSSTSSVSHGKLQIALNTLQLKLNSTASPTINGLTYNYVVGRFDAMSV